MLGYVWEDLTNYKKCRKKQYDIHVCKPPVNTVVINVLEQADVVAALGGKTYFTVEEITTMKANNDNRFNLLQQALQAGRAYLVSANTPFVLAGSQGELWCISANTLAKKYNFVTGQGTEPINQQTLQRRMKNDCLDWTVVRTVPDNSQAWACFVNQSLRGQIATPWGAVLNINGAGVPHGKGDFVIAADAGGKPNLADRYVVNGNVFANTYNNQGWTDCLSTQAINNGTVNISDLPKLFNSASINSKRSLPKNLLTTAQNIIQQEATDKKYSDIFKISPKKDPQTYGENTIRFIFTHKITHAQGGITLEEGKENFSIRKGSETYVIYDIKEEYNAEKFKQGVLKVFNNCMEYFMQFAKKQAPKNLLATTEDIIWEWVVDNLIDNTFEVEAKKSTQANGENTIKFIFSHKIYDAKAHLTLTDNSKKLTMEEEGVPDIHILHVYANEFDTEFFKGNVLGILNMFVLRVKNKAEKQRPRPKYLEEKIGIKPNGLFNKYLDSIREKYVKSSVKPDSTIIIDNVLTTIDKLPQYKRGTTIFSLAEDVERSYKHFVNPHDNVEQNCEEYSNTWDLAEKCVNFLKNYGLDAFQAMPVNRFYWLIFEAKYKYCFYSAAKADKDATYEKPSFCFYIPIEFTSPEDNKNYCFIIKISDCYSSDISECYDCIIIQETKSLQDTYFESFKIAEAKGSLLTDNELFLKFLQLRYRDIERNWTQLSRDLKEHYIPNGGLVDPSKPYTYNIMCNYEDYYFYRDGFYTSKMNKEASLRVRGNALPGGNLLIALRLFDYVIGEALKDNGKFFELHPIDNIAHHHIDTIGKYITIISLTDASFYQLVGQADDEDIKIQLGTFTPGTYDIDTSKRLTELKLTKSMFDECYSFIDDYMLNEYEQKNRKYYEASAHRNTASLYKNLETTKCYKCIKDGMTKFTKPRKPSAEDCRRILRDVCNMFAAKITRYGINILTPFTNADCDYDDITIDGDNDNHLTLHFKLDLNKDYWGIKISGKTDKNTLNYTHVLVSEDSSITETSIDEITTTMIEQDVCEYLGVSKWRRFCTKNFIVEELPFAVDWTTPESSRRTSIVSFISHAFNTQFKLKCTKDSLLIAAKINGIGQVFEDKLEGAVTPDTVNELALKLLTLALNGVTNEATKSAIIAIFNYKSNVYTSRQLLGRLREINDNTLKFGMNGYEMTSEIRQDGTVQSDSVCIGDNYKSLPIAGFPEAVQVFMNMAHYYKIH